MESGLQGSGGRGRLLGLYWGQVMGRGMQQAQVYFTGLTGLSRCLLSQQGEECALYFHSQSSGAVSFTVPLPSLPEAYSHSQLGYKSMSSVSQKEEEKDLAPERLPSGQAPAQGRI